MRANGLNLGNEKTGDHLADQAENSGPNGMKMEIDVIANSSAVKYLR